MILYITHCYKLLLPIIGNNCWRDIILWPHHEAVVWSGKGSVHWCWQLWNLLPHWPWCQGQGCSTECCFPYCKSGQKLCKPRLLCISCKEWLFLNYFTRKYWILLFIYYMCVLTFAVPLNDQLLLHANQLLIV